jgi:hypothetical protein
MANADSAGTTFCILHISIDTAMRAGRDGFLQGLGEKLARHAL